MSVNRRVTNRGTVYDVRLRTVDGNAYKRSFRTRRAAEVFEARERRPQPRHVARPAPSRGDVRRCGRRVAREQPGETAGHTRTR